MGHVWGMYFDMDKRLRGSYFKCSQSPFFFAPAALDWFHNSKLSSANDPKVVVFVFSDPLEKDCEGMHVTNYSFEFTSDLSAFCYQKSQPRKCSNIHFLCLVYARNRLLYWSAQKEEK